MKTSDNNDELITRLKTVLTIEDEHGERDAEDEEGEESRDYDDDDQDKNSENNSRIGSRRRTKCLLTF